MHVPIVCIILFLNIIESKLVINANRSRRITGDLIDDLGITAYTRMINKWPWVVRLQFSNEPSRRCGGALISKNLLLTAAHCVIGLKPDQIAVHIGDVHTMISDPGEYMASVQEIIVHRSYHRMSINLNHCDREHKRMSICVNDLALIVLRKSITCQYAILLPWSQPTVSVFNRRFPPPIDLSEFTNCHVAGWGFTSVVGPDSDLLRDADVSVMNLQQCNSTCRYGGSLARGMICAAGDGQRGQDACTGDSGGPLMCTKDNIWHLVGIVSWGFGCGDPSKPGVYSDLGYYQEWILSELIRRPRLEADFWNSLLECKSNYLRIRECYDPWDYEILRSAGILCTLSYD